MKVTIVGTGYVGLVSGVCFAELGHHVTCIDIDKKKVELLSAGEPIIYEVGLDSLLKKNLELKTISFSTDYSSISNADIIFLAVGTPQSENGDADLSYIKEAARSVGRVLRENAIVIIKSTVPVGTSKIVRHLIKEETAKNFHIINNPEFLKEGTAVDDFMKPDRIVLGGVSDWALEQVEELYRPLIKQGYTVYKMSNASAEVTKYASNTMLATKITFMNEMAQLCDALGANIDAVRLGVGSDKRIGKEFLYAGPGYGGSCFPKDVQALIRAGQRSGVLLEVAEATHNSNNRHKEYISKKILSFFDHNIEGKCLSVWGLAFKSGTDDVRESPALSVVEILLKHGATVRVYDPEASEKFKLAIDSRFNGVTPEKLSFWKTKYECAEHSEALVVMTDWNEFKVPDVKLLSEKMKTKAVVFDMRNVLDEKSFCEAGFSYFSVGRPASVQTFSKKKSNKNDKELSNFL